VVWKVIFGRSVGCNGRGFGVDLLEHACVVDERHTEISRRKLNMVNVAARCRLCDDPPPPPPPQPCRLAASSDSAVRLRPECLARNK